MKLELDKYGIQMPAFNKIGGILANELSVDEAAGERASGALIGRPEATTHLRVPTSPRCGDRHQRGGGSRGRGRDLAGSEEPQRDAEGPAGGAGQRLPGDAATGQKKEGSAGSRQGEDHGLGLVPPCWTGRGTWAGVTIYL